MSHIYDLIIIGSGPAGLAAAVYAQRAKLDTLVVEKAMVSGGQVLTTYEVDNYPGLPGIGGYDLGIKFREHADRLGARFVEDEVLNIQDGGKGAIKGVVCQGNTYEPGLLYLPPELCTGSWACRVRKSWQEPECPTVPPATGHFSAIRSRLSSEAAMWLWRMPFSWRVCAARCI